MFEFLYPFRVEFPLRFFVKCCFLHVFVPLVSPKNNTFRPFYSNVITQMRSLSVTIVNIFPLTITFQADDYDQVGTKPQVIMAWLAAIHDADPSEESNYWRTLNYWVINFNKRLKWNDKHCTLVSDVLTNSGSRTSYFLLFPAWKKSIVHIVDILCVTRLEMHSSRTLRS